MLTVFDPERFRRAADRFHDFFTELRELFVEREEVVTQFELALLSREHLLMTGPPGTAKSQMASAVLKRIIDERTGEPSVFARQFTENTVQTDLVGPIDFKTLIESGRTTHFTEEGMLGSIHAFLDEVFDGRDMLLRSTLNLLQERELKEGNLVTRGEIECAIMTSNRYISEILESSRETLLAFIDRIAFVSFIPRSFADSANLKLVVRRHGGGFGRPSMNKVLTVQDLDVLQDAADRIFVPHTMCDELARFVGNIDSELASAMRADPNFQPTRYLSTRTAVRATRVIRAAAVLDKIHKNSERMLQARWDDLRELRHFLVLSGVSRDRIGKLLQHETDPRERRQLDIMRTEAEIFDRCYGKLDRKELPPKPPALDLPELRSMATSARRSGESEALIKAAHALATAAQSGAHGADMAGQLLLQTIGTVSGQALRAGMLSPSSSSASSFLSGVRRLGDIADSLEFASAAQRPLARWLRGRLMELLDESLRLTPSPTAETLSTVLSKATPDALLRQAEDRLRSMDAFKQLRHDLEVKGCWVEESARSNRDGWAVALAKLEDELVLICDARVRDQVKEVLATAGEKRLSEVLKALSSIAGELGGVRRKLELLGRDHRLLKRVMGPHLEPIVALLFSQMEASDRSEVIKQVEEIAVELEKTDFEDLIDVDKFVSWSAPALIRDERRRSAPYQPVRSLQDYHGAKNQEDPLTVAETLLEIALRLMPPETFETEHPKESMMAIKEVMARLPEELQQEVIDLDLARLDRGITCLEEWWSTISARKEIAATEPDVAMAMMEEVVSSGFLRVMRGEADLLQFVVAAKNLADIFPGHSQRADPVGRRVEALDSLIGSVLAELLEGCSQRAWKVALDRGRDS